MTPAGRSRWTTMIVIIVVGLVLSVGIDAHVADATTEPPWV